MQFQLRGLAVNSPIVHTFLSRSATMPYTVSKFHLATSPLLKINHLWQTKMANKTVVNLESITESLHNSLLSQFFK